MAFTLRYALPSTPPTTQLLRGHYYRVVRQGQADRGYPAYAPNPFTGICFSPTGGVLGANGELADMTRFSPFADQSGTPVPTLYVANTREAAYCETFLRPASASSDDLYLSDVEDLYLATLVLKQDLTLLSLDDAQFEHGIFGELTRAELLDSTELLYDQTTVFARTCYREYPAIAGMLWTSRQYANNPCAVLFGDRFDWERQLRTEEERSLMSAPLLEHWLYTMINTGVVPSEDLKQKAREVLQSPPLLSPDRK